MSDNNKSRGYYWKRLMKFMEEDEKLKEYYKGQPLRLYRLEYKDNKSDLVNVEIYEAYSKDEAVNILTNAYKDLDGNLGKDKLTEIFKVVEITNIDTYLDCMFEMQQQHMIIWGCSKERAQQVYEDLHMHVVDNYFPIWKNNKKETTECASKGVCSTGENDVFKALDSNEVFGEFDTPVELEAQFEEEDQRYKKATRDKTKAYRVEYRVNPGWDSFVDIIEISNTENIMQKIQSYFENRKESVTVVNLTEIESIHECIKYAHDTYISLLQRKCPVCKAKEIISELLAYLLNRYLIRWVKYDRW